MGDVWRGCDPVPERETTGREACQPRRGASPSRLSGRGRRHPGACYRKRAAVLGTHIEVIESTFILSNK
jgi:hypothetical protein